MEEPSIGERAEERDDVSRETWGPGTERRSDGKRMSKMGSRSSSRARGISLRAPRGARGRIWHLTRPDKRAGPSCC